MKNIFAIGGTALVVIIVVVFFVAKGKNDGSATSNPANESAANAVTTENGTQIITIIAKGGYTPRTVTAKANMPTVIRMKSAGAFDCSASVVIPDLQFEKYLQPQKTAEVPVPLEKTQGTLKGLCSMGMYNFEIHFAS